jgi:hypothetical protein
MGIDYDIIGYNAVRNYSTNWDAMFWHLKNLDFCCYVIRQMIILVTDYHIGISNFANTIFYNYQ